MASDLATQARGKSMASDLAIAKYPRNVHSSPLEIPLLSTHLPETPTPLTAALPTTAKGQGDQCECPALEEGANGPAIHGALCGNV